MQLDTQKTYIIGVTGPDTRLSRLIQAMASDVPIPEDLRWTHCVILYHDGTEWQVIESDDEHGARQIGLVDWMFSQQRDGYVPRQIDVREANVNTAYASLLLGTPFYPMHSWVKSLRSGKCVPIEESGMHCGELVALCLPEYHGEPRTTHPSHLQIWFYEKQGVIPWDRKQVMDN